MKCKHCNGTGKVRGYFYEKTGVNKWEKVWGDSPCDECGGTGKIQQTNEEWLRSCTTEELVKMILDLCDDRPCFACGIGYCEDENWCHVYSDEAKEFVMEWLKQAHTDKE